MVMQVGVGVNGAAGDVELLAWADQNMLAVDGAGDDAVEDENTLVVIAVQVRDAEVEAGGMMSSKRSRAPPVSWRLWRKVTLILPI
ncbi:hypothetical protein [Tunturiibacter gelidiferens]|uniref:hypothetical protein n=1 Tax=Tunturiibacter gelidiferens TaxID=3069689 RepID=UPI003D9BF5A7